MKWIIKGEKERVFNELTTRLNYYKLLFFKPKSLRYQMKVYHINDKYSPVLQLQIKNVVNEFQDKTDISYCFILDEECFFILEIKRNEKDSNFIKSFFFDFYDFLLENTEVEQYFELKKWFSDVIKKWSR